MEKTAEKEIEKVIEKEVEEEASKIAIELAEDAAAEVTVEAATEASMGPVGWALLAFDAVSMGLDIWDPADYKSYKTSDYWKKISNSINSTWKSNIKKVNKDFIKKYKAGKTKKLIQIKDPHVVGPLDKLTTKYHQDQMQDFIKDYQHKNIGSFSKEYFNSIKKDEINNMVNDYVKNTDFTKLIPNYHDLTPVQLAQKKMELFQGDDPNSPLNKKMIKFIGNKLKSYLNSKQATYDFNKHLCNTTSNGRFIEVGAFKGFCTFNSKSSCNSTFDWNKIKTKNDGSYAQFYTKENPYHYTSTKGNGTETNICLTANWKAQIRKMCENNTYHDKIKNKDTSLPLTFNEVTNICDTNKNYCDYYAMDYMKDDKGYGYCSTSDSDKFGQFLFGSTIYKGIRKTLRNLPGRECNDDANCSDKYGSSRDSCFNYKCVSRVGLHHPCWRDTNCGKNKYGKDMICMSGGNRVGKNTSGAVGLCQTCWNNDQCSNERTCLDLQCKEKRSNGTACWRDNNCKSNICLSGGGRTGSKSAAAIGKCCKSEEVYAGVHWCSDDPELKGAKIAVAKAKEIAEAVVAKAKKLAKEAAAKTKQLAEEAAAKIKELADKAAKALKLKEKEEAIAKALHLKQLAAAAEAKAAQIAAAAEAKAAQIAAAAKKEEEAVAEKTKEIAEKAAKALHLKQIAVAAAHTLHLKQVAAEATRIKNAALAKARQAAHSVAHAATSTWHAFTGLFCDKRLKSNLKLLIKDHFAPGVHLYYYKWNDLAFKEFNLSGWTIGPIADEVEIIYPEIIKEYKGFKGINMDSLINHNEHKFKYLFSHYLKFNINKLSNEIGLDLDENDNKIIEPYNNYDTFASI